MPIFLSAIFILTAAIVLAQLIIPLLQIAIFFLSLLVGVAAKCMSLLFGAAVAGMSLLFRGAIACASFLCKAAVACILLPFCGVYKLFQGIYPLFHRKQPYPGHLQRYTQPTGFSNDYIQTKPSRFTDVQIPSSVTHIGSEAFSGCSELTNVTISPIVTSSCSPLSITVWQQPQDDVNGKRFGY